MYLTRLSFVSFSLKCGLALGQEILLLLWDIYIKKESLKYLPNLSNYLMERPTFPRKFLNDRMTQTVRIILNVNETSSKMHQKIQMIHALLPSLMSVNIVDFAEFDKQMVQSLVNLCVNGIEKYPKLGNFLDRVKSVEDELKEKIFIPDYDEDFNKNFDLENQLLGNVFLSL